MIRIGNDARSPRGGARDGGREPSPGARAGSAALDHQPSHIDLSHGSLAERSDQWEAALADTYVSLSVRVKGDGERAGGDFIRHQHLHDLALVDMRCSPCSAARTRSRVSVDARDYVAVLLMTSGREEVSASDAQIVLSSGEVAVWDTTQVVQFDNAETFSKRNLLIPRPTLTSVLGRSRPLRHVSLCGPGARVLAGYLDVLSSTLAELSVADLLAARNATVELLGGLLRADGSSIPWGAAPALRAGIDRWLDANLRADVTPAAAAAAHAISVRTLHRLFAESGEGFAAVVRHKRLARARDELLTTNQPVTTIATRWRFTDASHFTRVFRERYGMPPGAYRASVRIEAG
jgi:AraC family transcriptional regulator, positive regulator of tynA and feaB